MIKSNIIVDKKTFDFSVKRLCKRILKKTCRILKVKSKHVVSYIFVDIEKIHEINLDYRKIDRPTDVISFAYGDDSENDELPFELGDVFICVEKVFEQASLYGHSAYRECAFLMTHGILHLLGFDHMEKDDEKIMFELQDRILDELNIKR